ncbi:hypothetical protein AG1IA_04533 [Rhizoctonia solani AG-1 IA]|uniref:Peroxin domain-containing protein n=1 Tax=Thanatephorus cucumeris (strain AG1-IA) TaxID=983506 RepID=L8WX95_THACA|nr:hypothetical protein AG1IA_04533 [Rhizoctonia solani AG-1 IA]
MSQRNSLIVSEPMSSSSFPTLPSASHEPVPEAQQHLAARHKRRISLRPHRLSVHGSKSNDDSLRSNRRRGVDLNIVELDAEPEPDCVINTDVRVENGSQSQDDDESKDLYEWAILYENQRGITLFSIPYYSKLSLLPNDRIPPANNSSCNRGPFRLSTPRSHMALGEVQQDGYEYNWCFRSKGWRASIGSFNAGGWVRRRRWVRLMMRPANAVSPLRSSTFEVESTSPSSTDPVPTPGSTTTINESEKNEKGDALIWRGDEDDWSRVRDALRNFRSDGRRLEAWERWLALEEQALLVRATERLGIGVGNGIKLRMDDWDLRHAIDPASPISRDTTPGTLHIRAPVPSKDVVLPVLRENVSSVSTSALRCD